MVSIGDMCAAWVAPDGQPVSVVVTSPRAGVQPGSVFVLRAGWLRDVEAPAPVDAPREVPSNARLERLYLAGEIDFLTLCQGYGVER